MRSLLFVPGDSERKLTKALGGEADAIVLDLEDAVLPDRKVLARDLVLACLKRRDEQSPRCFVRVNALDTGLTVHDLAAVMPAAPEGIMLPKCEGPADLEVIGHHLSALEAAFGQEVGSTLVLAVATETPRAVLSLRSETWQHPRLLGLLWGAEDLSACLGTEGNRTAEGDYLNIYRGIRQDCLIAARAAGVVPIDAVYTRITDLDGLRGEIRSGRELGFEAKAAIHPTHIPLIHEGMSPSPEQIAWAERVIAAFESDDASGALRLDGEMLDRPHLVRAQRIMAVASVSH